MRFFSTLLDRNVTVTNLILIGLVAVTLMAARQYAYDPLSDLTVRVFKEPIVGLRESLRDISDVRAKNRQLLEALMQATLKINELKSQKEENDRLRAQLGFPPPTGFRLIPIEPVAVSYRGLPVAIQVNKGTAMGLAVGQPVVSRQGLVGRISEVSVNNAAVQLLSDPRCRVSGRVEESRELGIVRYRPSVGLILDNVPLDGQVKAGDLIISSGLGGVFPEGLAVGVVERVQRDKSKLFAEVTLRPTVTFTAIDELFALAPVGSEFATQ